MRRIFVILGLVFAQHQIGFGDNVDSFVIESKVAYQQLPLVTYESRLGDNIEYVVVFKELPPFSSDSFMWLELNAATNRVYIGRIGQQRCEFDKTLQMIRFEIQESLLRNSYLWIETRLPADSNTQYPDIEQMVFLIPLVHLNEWKSSHSFYDTESDPDGDKLLSEIRSQKELTTNQWSGVISSFHRNATAFETMRARREKNNPNQGMEPTSANAQSVVPEG